MVRARADRSLATVVFVDIVDSTRIASELGDRRWRELLSGFRRAMRAQLRANHGQEQDTAGDGFFATFDRPASAVRAAVGVVEAVQALGLDARCGIHTGELERIDGRLGGIAAHIGARVMALAGPAEVLVTGTVHDLVVGGGIGFEPAHETDLKGVPGRWTLYRVVELDGAVAPGALPHAMALDRRAASVGPGRSVIPARRAVALGVAVAGALGVAALGTVLLTLPRDNPSLAGEPSDSPASSRPPSLVRIDPGTNQVVQQVVDRHLPIGREGPLFVVDGVLWQDTLVNMVRRHVETGEAIATIDQPAASYSGVPAFGSLWFDVVDVSYGLALSGSLFHRVDPLSGRVIAVVEVEEPVGGIAAVPTGFVFLTNEHVLELDAESNEIVDADAHGFDPPPDAVVAIGGNVWICECDEGRLTQWDLETDAAVRTIELAQRGLFLEDQRELSQGSVTIDASVLWLMDREAGTITPVDTATGEAGQPIGIPRNAGWHVFGLGSIWIGAGDEVYRFDIATQEATSIPLPEGVTAGGLAADEASGTVWVSNYIPAGAPVPDPLPSESAGASAGP